MTQVPSHQIQFHPLSFGDFNGRLFSWEGKLLRGMTAKRASMYRSLFSDGTVERLVHRNLLVETTIADLDVEGFDLVVEHRQVPFVSYAFEWPAGMIKAAALLTLDLEIELAGRGLTLQDAHPWNVLFDGTSPRWVDLGSIVEDKADTPWRAYDEFCHFYLHPLEVMAKGHHRVARRMLVDCDDGVLPQEARAITGDSLGRRVGALMNKVVRKTIGGRRRASLNRRPAFLRRLRTRVEQIPIRPPLTSASFARNGSRPQIDPGLRQALLQAVAELRPGSIFEVAYEGPFYTADNDHAVKLLGVSADDGRVEELYQGALARGADVLPLVLDVRNPSPAYGVCGQTAAAASQRLPCDLVVAFGVTHQLGVRYRLNFHQIAAALATFARRAVLVDFVPGDHPATRPYWGSDFAWYTRENFEAALRRRFARVRALHDGIYLCEGGGA